MKKTWGLTQSYRKKTKGDTCWWKSEKPAWSALIWKRKRIKFRPSSYSFGSQASEERQWESEFYWHKPFLPIFSDSELPAARVVGRLHCAQMKSQSMLTALQGVCWKKPQYFTWSIWFFLVPLSPARTSKPHTATANQNPTHPLCAPWSRSQGQQPRNSSVWHICTLLCSGLISGEDSALGM